MSEHNHQRTTVAHFKIQYPSLSDCIIAIPNGAHLAGSPKQRARKMDNMKKEGFKNGASDLFIAVPRGTFHGMWLEMKDEGKTKCSLSNDQAAHLELMEKQGYHACWAAGCDEAIKLINDYMEL